MHHCFPRPLVPYLMLNYWDSEFCERKKESNIYKEKEYIQMKPYGKKSTIRIPINVDSGYSSIVNY